jgi:hypothetical protein
MPKLVAEDSHVNQLRAAFAAIDDLDHLRVRRRADLAVVESGPVEAPIAHARFRRVSARLWTLEMATHTGRWQPSGMQGALDALVEALINDFGWTLTRII